MFWWGRYIVTCRPGSERCSVLPEPQRDHLGSLFPTSFNEGLDVSRSWQCIMKPYNEMPLAQIKHRWWLDVDTVGYGLQNEFCGITPQAPLSHAVVTHGHCLQQPQQWMQQLHGHRWQDTATVLLEQNFCLKKKLLPISHGELSLIKTCTLRVNLQ